MGELSWRDVYDVDLKPLGTAVEQWDDMVGKLSGLSRDARDGMRKKSENARWRGVNADVTRPFVRQVADEFDDVHTEAKDLRTELKSAYTALKSIQDELQKAVDTARKKGIEIRDAGKGRVRCLYPPQPGHQGEQLTEKQREELKEVAEQISALVKRADERDHRAATVLAKIHGNDPHNFAKNGQIDAYEAKQANKLARHGADMSDKQLRELSTLMKYNKNDPAFTHRFFQGLGGPKETLDFYARMSIDATDGGSKTRLDAAQDLQRYMGPALANATDPDRKGYLDWGAQFRRLGTKEFDVGERGFRPKGYQILSGLLRNGHYDKRFLLPIAEHVVQLQHKNPRGYWNRPMDPDQDFGLNPGGRRESGYDPVTGVLEALGHSPEASQEFFSVSPTENPGHVYNDDGTLRKGEPLEYSYLKELTSGEYRWNDDGGVPEKGTDKPYFPGKNALGHALESATIGTPYDRPASENPPPHTEVRAQITKDLLAYNSKNSAFASADISDSLGRIAGEYMPEINSSLTPEGKDLFGVEHSITFDKKNVVKFLDSAAAHPEGNAAVSLGAQNYGAKVMHEVISSPGDFRGTDAANAKHVTHGVGTIEGIVGSARHDAIMSDGQLKEADFNEAVERRGELLKTLLGAPLGAVGERAPIAGEAMTGVSEHVIDSVVESHQKNTVESDADRAASVSFNTRAENSEWAQRTLREAGFPEHVNKADYLKEIGTTSESGYDHGEALRRDAHDNQQRRLADQ